MKDTGYNNITLKQKNRGLVLRLIATGECTSRIELAKKTGLSKMAATNIISEFILNDIVEEREKIQTKGKGRNPIQLCISPKAPKLIGVHIYRSECHIVLTDLMLQIQDSETFSLSGDNAKDLMDLIMSGIDDLMKRNKTERFLGIGVGSLGPVDITRGMILNPPHFWGISDLAIVSLLTDKYDLPVAFDSQYNCAALAEKYFGNGRDIDDFLFLGLADGIGSGIIVSGDRLPNRSGFTSELGHITIDWNGEECSCKSKGCLEQYIGTKAIEGEVKKKTGLDKSFREICDMAPSVKEIDEILTGCMQMLGSGLVSMVNLFYPQKIIMGHEGYWIPMKYLHQVEEQINHQILCHGYHQVRVEKSFWNEETHVRGCASPLLRKIFNGSLVL